MHENFDRGAAGGARRRGRALVVRLRGGLRGRLAGRFGRRPGLGSPVRTDRRGGRADLCRTGLAGPRRGQLWCRGRRVLADDKLPLSRPGRGPPRRRQERDVQTRWPRRQVHRACRSANTPRGQPLCPHAQPRLSSASAAVWAVPWLATPQPRPEPQPTLVSAAATLLLRLLHSRTQAEGPPLSGTGRSHGERTAGDTEEPCSGSDACGAPALWKWPACLGDTGTAP
ncbi:uncharacterized protein LOC134383378 [Cynocephalus volans]|uniref:uncharacterized protein LOC134383378 n=1 Tax=Cynocephalus volans TaxID=110931 RepID=UPI002FC8CBCA